MDTKYLHLANMPTMRAVVAEAQRRSAASPEVGFWKALHKATHHVSPGKVRNQEQFLTWTYMLDYAKVANGGAALFVGGYAGPYGADADALLCKLAALIA